MLFNFIQILLNNLVSMFFSYSAIQTHKIFFSWFKIFSLIILILIIVSGLF